MTTTAQGRELIHGGLHAAWVASSTTKDLTLLFADVKGAGKPKAEKGRTPPAYGHSFVQHTAGEQCSMGRVGNRRFQQDGMATVQVFTPIGDGLVLSDAIGEVILGFWRTPQTVSGVCFFDMYPVEVGESGPWAQVNYVSRFFYQRIA